MFPLHPNTPSDGMTLEKLFGQQVDVDVMRTQMEALMSAEGLPYGYRSHTYNTRRAQQLAKWADKQPGGDAIHGALYRAYFVDGINLGDLDRLLEIATSVGLSGVEARKALEYETELRHVTNDWKLAKNHQITAVPTYLSEDRILVGAQSYEVLEELILHAGAVLR
tara:strand:+ start:3361 stop:3858 length:498 start_codon:yes stop_codon:yes gene_type:complete